jgi:E3 ubiquitin-protein ligase listerin
MSTPVSTCRELALSIVQDLPSSLIQEDTLQTARTLVLIFIFYADFRELQMCHLVMDSSVDVQKMSFQLLREAARKRTEYLVVEAGVDTEGTFKAELPQEMVVILSSLQGIDAEAQVQSTSSTLHAGTDATCRILLAISLAGWLRLICSQTHR